MRERRPKGFGAVIVRTRKDGSQSFMLKVTREGRDFYKTVAAQSEKAAKDMLPVFIAEIQSGAVAAKRAKAKMLSEQPTFAEWTETFLSRHVSQDEDRMATRAAYGNVLRLYVLPALGRHKLADISGPMIRDCLQDAHRQGRAIRTIQLAHAALRRALEAAIDDGYLKENPTPRFLKLRLGQVDSASESAKRRALSAPQVTALLDACGDDPGLRLFVAIGASLGLRPGETLGLQWRDVDLKKGNLHVRHATKLVYRAKGEAPRLWIGAPKTASGRRTIAIGPALAALFAAERERQEAVQRELLGRDPNVRDMKALVPPDACVFCADPATAEGLISPRNPNSLGRQFRRAAKRAGLPHVTPHWLRHTAISHAIAEGTSLADAAKRAGHKSPALTAAVYTHSVTEGEKKAALIGDSLLAPAKSADLEQIPNSDKR